MIKETFRKYGWLVIGLNMMACLSPSVYGQTNTNLNNLVDWLTSNVALHPSVLAAQSAVEASQYQRVAAAKALYNPELELSTESVGKLNTTTLGISQTMDWGDSRAANTALARAQLRANTFQLALTEQNIRVELLSALAQYHTHSALTVLAKQRLDLMRRFVHLTEQRFTYGDLGQVDVDFANLSYAQARFTQANHQADFLRSRYQLKSLTQDVESSWPLMPVDLPKPTQQIVDAERQVQQLPAMRLALASIKVAQAGIKKAVALAVVNPTLSLQAGKEGSSDVVGLSFSMPLQLRNNYQSEVDVENAQMIQSERDAKVVYLELIAGYKVALGSYRLSHELWLFWQQFGSTTLSEQMSLLEKLWNAGELSTSDYLTQLTEALKTKEAVIVQRGQLWHDWVQWQRANGNIEPSFKKAGETE